jgi:hypothetical protein
MTLRMHLTEFEKSWLVTWALIALSHATGLIT